MLYILPIEPLEERYSAQWMRWTISELNKLYQSHKIYHRFIHPMKGSYGKIKNGSFLDCVGTNIYKAHQLTQMLELIQSGQVTDDDVIWIHDAWFPGLQMLAYARDGLGLKFRMYGMLHAGTYDMHDFLYKKGMTCWGRAFEQSIINLLDGVFVATNYHKDLLCAYFTDTKKIRVMDFPIYKDWKDNDHKENIIVFPHRLDSEKQPHLFDVMEDMCKNEYAQFFSDYQFVKTKEVCQTKEQYYDMLGRSKYAVSFALQETWGIAMQEAVLSGCVPVVPSRLSYEEMYPEEFRYISTEYDSRLTAKAVIDKIIELDTRKIQNSTIFHCLKSRFRDRGINAIEGMVAFMMPEYFNVV